MENRRIEIASLVLVTLGLIGVLQFGLLGVLLPAMITFYLAHALSPILIRLGLTHRVGRLVAVAISLVIVGIAVGFGVSQIVSMIKGPDSLIALVQRMAEVTGALRQYLPESIHEYLPANIEDIQITVSKWIRLNAAQFSQIGQNAGRVLFHIVAGMIIAGLAAFYDIPKKRPAAPLVEALVERATILGGAFRNVVFSQIRISALNTTLTAIYLIVVLPAFGVHLPLVKTMIAVTFIAGLLPILGNLISNTVITLISLSVSIYVAFAALGYLIVIHKLEYFVNARIIGGRINARAWEILTVMLTMEAIFGIPGLIAAPIYYAYLKDELTRLKLI